MNTFSMCNGTTNLLKKQNIYFMLYELIQEDWKEQFNFPFFYVDEETFTLIQETHPDVPVGEALEGVTNQPSPVSVRVFPVSKRTVKAVGHEEYCLMVFLNIKAMLLAAFQNYPHTFKQIQNWTEHQVEPVENYSADDLKSELRYFLSIEHYGGRYYPSELREQIQKTYPFEESLHVIAKTL